MERIAKAVLLTGSLLTVQACGLTDPKYIDYTDESTDGAPTDDGATDDATDDGGTPEATYTSNVKALLDGKCALSGCHVAGAQAPDLSTYAFAKTGGPRSQVRIDAGTMPTSGPLSAAEKALFKSWFDAGYPE